MTITSFTEALPMPEKDRAMLPLLDIKDDSKVVLVALKLKEVFGLEDISQLPISFDIAWYEQKAVTVLLALLFLGVKGIRLGPTIPAFLSPNGTKVLVEKFGLKPIGNAEENVAVMGVGA